MSYDPHSSLTDGSPFASPWHRIETSQHAAPSRAAVIQAFEDRWTAAGRPAQAGIYATLWNSSRPDHALYVNPQAGTLLEEVLTHHEASPCAPPDERAVILVIGGADDMAEA